tara:strand:- start:171 stop:2054 length:1884 start_codon:yes stop_codon:yes gene_type:complete
MFLSSYEKLRKKLILNKTLLSMAHIGPRGFDTIGGEVVSTTSFIIQNKLNRVYKGQFYRLVDGNSESEKSRLLKEGIANSNCGYFFRVSSKDLEKIDGAPIIYWLSDSLRSLFNSENKIDDIADKVTKGIYTGDNNRFLRLWYEISFGNKGWKKYDKAGGSRRWFGSAMHILDWRNDGEVLSKFKGAGIGAMKYFDKPHLVWSGLTSGNPSFRYADKYVWFDDASPSIVGSQASEKLLSFLNCNISTKLLMTLNPTINYQIGDVKRIPVGNLNDIDSKIAKRCIEISRFDWDSYEISWDFKSSPLLSFNSNLKKIEIAYNYFRKDREKITNEMILLEEENNRLFIEKYRLHNELKKNIENHEITLNCNPAYRYGDKCIPRVQEENFLKDTLKEFISYSVGCMFGRYSLEQPGLILANQGENLADYFKRIPYPSFKPDADNIIPILSSDWFEDDITARFKKFLRITFSNENFEDNLRFIENSIGKDIRKYFLIEFYKDHIQTYKKRPIYWMFSSPKGSFNALIYMHLYKKDTVSILLEKYLSEFLLKLRAKRNIFKRLEVNNDSYSKEKTKAIKEIQKIDSILSELKNWEKEVISPLASQLIEIDLDDGVKVNYSKFGTALKKVSGLN